MTHHEVIDRAVREAAERGLTLAEIIEPLLNMTASVVANTVVEHRLDAVEEIENVHQIVEELYEQYLEAYVAQPAA